MKKKKVMKESNDLKTAFVYARYSSERQTEQSIEGQIRVCNDYAERNGIKILDYYIDRAQTGTNDNRKDFQRMMRDCAASPCDYVLVYKLDRFSRNKYEMAIHRNTLRNHGIKILSAMENIPDTPEGIILESLLEGMAEYYSVELAQKVRRGQLESLRKGHWIGGQAPYGYKSVDKKLQINEDEAEIVRYIYQQYASGIIVKEIIKDLTARGIFYKGKPFKRATMYYILSSARYAGTYVYNDEVYENVVPRIISDTLFQKVQAIAEQNKLGTMCLEDPYLLRFKVFCGYCGRMIIAESGTAYSGEVKRYYKCGGRKENSGCTKQIVRKEDLEKIVVDTTINVLGEDENLDRIIDAVMEARKKKAHDESVLNLLSKDLAETEKAIENLLNAIQQGIITSSTKTRMEELERRADELKTAIALEQHKKGREITREQVREFIKTALKKSPRVMLNTLIDRVVLYDDKVEIYYNYTDDKDPNDHVGVFTIHGTLNCGSCLTHKKRNELNNLTVQLIPKWLLLSDSN